MARRTLLSTALLAAFVVPAVLIAPTSSAATSSAQSIDPQPVGVVVLVDESGSLQEPGVAAERAATETIVQSDPSTGSQLAVVGFAGSNGGQGQTPVDVVCQPTTVTAGTNRDYLAGCTTKLTPMSEQQGDDTDFPSALREGISLLNGMTGVRAKMIFMLTDGKLDVRRDPAYGPNPTARQQEGEAQLTQVLATAKTDGVSIWPLGFNQADQGELNQLAAGGAQANPLCPDNSRPTARLATGTDDILASLVDAFASARCEGHDGPVTGQVGPGQSGPTKLTLTIPAVATDGSIAVDKVDPTLGVTFVDPDGNTVPLPDGTMDGSTFQLSGQTSPVEVLRIENPLPGTWTVLLSPPTGSTTLTVSATVLWQGAVQSAIVLDPPSPRPGQSAHVELVLATRRGALADPSALAGISAGAVLSGNGFRSVNIALTPGAGGQFDGQLRMPGTGTGAFELVGQVSGTGISNDQRPLYGQFDTGTVTLIAQPTFDTGQVQPGGDLDGVVQFQNATTGAHDVTLRLTGVSGGLVTLSPNDYQVRPGTSQLPFRLHVAGNSPVGTIRGQLVISDVAGASAPYADPVFDIDVGYPPPWWQRNLAALIGAAVLVAVVVLAVLVVRRRRRRALEVHGLAARLYRDDQPRGRLDAPHGHGIEFRFTVEDEQNLQHATDSGGAPIVVRRSGPALLLVARPGRELARVRPGERLKLNDRCQIEITDDRPPLRHRSGRPPRPPRPARPEKSTVETEPQLQPVPDERVTTKPKFDDDLL